MSPALRNSQWPLVWIGPGYPLPDTCISCGMFTDRRVRASLVHEHVRMVEPGSSNSDVALGCLLHLLGPVGWILSAILMHQGSKQEPVSRTTRTRKTVRVPRCRLCHSTESVEPVRHRADGGLAFHVHPRFLERLEIVARSADGSRQGAGDNPPWPARKGDSR